MTDEELITRLREIGKHSFGWTADQAANRIEALVRESAEMEAEADAHIELWRAALREKAAAEARVERLEAVLRELVTCVEDGCFCSEMKMATAIDEAHAALKGADHE